MLKWVLLAQLCLPGGEYEEKSCVRIMGEPVHVSFDTCMFEGFDISQEIEDLFKDGGGFYYNCVDTFSIDTLDKYRN
jgi:hypothetical protein